MRFLAADIYRCRKKLDALTRETVSRTGEAWLTPSLQVFFLPDPDLINGIHWFDAEVIVDNLKDRWVGFEIPAAVKRFP